MEKGEAKSHTIAEIYLIPDWKGKNQISPVESHEGY